MRLPISQRLWSPRKGGYQGMLKAEHPMSSKGKTLMRHWYVMYEATTNKPALIKLRQMRASIHHRNGNRSDNRLSNLDLRLPGNHPQGVGAKDAILLLKALGYQVAKA